MIVGTAGHIDHGKTALVKALTGIDADRLAEEKARGITIDLGFAYTDLGGDDTIGFVDVPGHERLVHTMLAGVTGIDLALLVVAADDGVMPQTREHVAILDLLGLKRGVVAMTKADLADAERRGAAEAEIRGLLANSSLAEAPIVPVSALTGEGVAELSAMLRIHDVGAARPQRDLLFRLAVDRSFTLGGIGTVVTGTVLDGEVHVGDHVVVSPSGLPARVRAIHAQNKASESGHAGQRCALNLAGDGVTKEAISRGDTILDPALHAPTDRIDVELHILKDEPKPIGTWFPARLHAHATETGARIVPLGAPIGCGETGLAQLVLDRRIAAAVGDRFILRDVSASRTIGGGRFLDLRAPARKRGTPQRLALLAAASDNNPVAALRGQLAVGPIELAAFQRDRCLPTAGEAALCLNAGAERLAGWAVSVRQMQDLRRALLATLSEFHADNPDLAGLGREKLRLGLMPRLPADAFLVLLRHEAEAERIALDGAFVRLPGHAVQLTPQDQVLFDRIHPCLLGEWRFRPLRVRDLAVELSVNEKDVRRVLKLSQKLGRTDQIAHDHFFAREVMREMACIMVDVAAQAEDGWFTAPAFRDRVNNGRKVAIEILDFFDRLGVTLRRGDLRRINPHRIDLFTDAGAG
ncbi:selenocysteine-specific translation elongation factor [Mesorhizobium sp. GR13]|uniref:selenocysteine-specific translation elongation factor n=1 Tax=Mesorhizobium sp. GR13 TaxID=2562308 RepID=UPI0010BFA851|nr:selenocysteine-specific translation elongation factor [Mesorhizobium sp. GR13]